MRSPVATERPSSRPSIRSTGRVTAVTSGCGCRRRRAATREFFARWRDSLDGPASRVARRDYVMGKLTYLSGVRAAELCGVQIGDLHWESGQWGRFLVNGKGARGSGPRQREAYMFEEGRALLWWYMEDVRGDFCDDPGDPHAPLFPSERIPAAVSALNVATPGMAVTPSTFRRSLKIAGCAVPDRAGERSSSAPAAARRGDPQLRARDVAVGGAEDARP